MVAGHSNGIVALILGLSFSLSVGCTWFIERYAKIIGFIDRPNERSSHQGDIPRGAGLGILCSTLIASLILSVPYYFWISAVVIALLSFWGDKVTLSPIFRLSFQFIASFFVLAGLFSGKYPLSAEYLIIVPFSIFIVGTANYYNFMDGINGIAGITGVIGFGLLAFYASISRAEHWLIILPVCMSLSCLGFLPFNIPKAKVFMGDW